MAADPAGVAETPPLLEPNHLSNTLCTHGGPSSTQQPNNSESSDTTVQLISL